MPGDRPLCHVDVSLDEPVVGDGGAAEGPVAASLLAQGSGIDDIDGAPARQILLVNGSLLVGPDGELRLWEALAEPYHGSSSR